MNRPIAIDDAPGTPGGVPTLWAWLAVDAMGGEGIVAATLPGFGAIQLITGREEIARGPFYRAIMGMFPPMGRRFELRRYEAVQRP